MLQWNFSSLSEDKSAPFVSWHCNYLPDVSRLRLQVIPTMVHVIKSVLEQGSFLRVSQGFHHLLSVSINAFKDVIMGINFSLDVLKYRQVQTSYFSKLKKSLFLLVFLSSWTEHIAWHSWATLERGAEKKSCNTINIIIKGPTFFSENEFESHPWLWNSIYSYKYYVLCLSFVLR